MQVRSVLTSNMFQIMFKPKKYVIWIKVHSMEYNKKCISSRFLKLTYPTFNNENKYSLEINNTLFIDSLF